MRPGALARRTTEPWTPLKSGKRDHIALIELHSLAFEELPLTNVVTAPRSEANLAFGVDHTVPGDATVAGKGIEGVADKTRMPGNTGDASDLTISGDASTRNP